VSLRIIGVNAQTLLCSVATMTALRGVDWPAIRSPVTTSGCA
jgi:hypothetical protein